MQKKKPWLLHTDKHLKFPDFKWDRYSATQVRTQGGGGVGGCNAVASQQIHI